MVWFDRPIRTETPSKSLVLSVDDDVLLHSSSTSGVKLFQQSISSDALSILCLFFMRGAWSNQLYQPKVNHRPMDYRKFMEPHKSSDDSRVHPPLMASMMDSDLTYKFDTSTPMTLHFYELERTQSDIPFTQTIRTTSPLRTDLCDSNTTEYLEGCLADAKAVPITANAFTRLCCLFNVKWTGDEVTLRDLKGFVALLSGCSITSVEDLKAFVKRFQMEHLFCVDENTGVTSQLNRLGKLFRALVSVRIGVLPFIPSSLRYKLVHDLLAVLPSRLSSRLTVAPTMQGSLRANSAKAAIQR